MQDIFKKNLPTMGRYNGMAYMLYHHTYTIGSVYLIRTSIILRHHEFIKITSNVISGHSIGVPDRIKIVGRGSGRNICRLLKARVVLVGTLSAVKRCVPKLVVDLTLMILVGIVRVTSVSTTIMTSTTTTAATMRSNIGQHMILLGVECLRADQLNHTIDLLNQGVVVGVETTQNI
jgi:hypothetical protein